MQNTSDRETDTDAHSLHVCEGGREKDTDVHSLHSQCMCVMQTQCMSVRGGERKKRYKHILTCVCIY